MNSFLISENDFSLIQISGRGMGALTQLDTEYQSYRLSLRADHHLSSIVFTVARLQAAISTVLKSFKTEDEAN